jgi:hypothetical protein
VVLRSLLFDGQQPCKIVVDPRRFDGVETGFPERVIEAYPEGIPLDLDPTWPLELDLDSDPENLALNLSFSGRVCRCHIPWAAVAMIAAGMGSASWAHEAEDSQPPPPGAKAGTRAGHLRVLK